MTVTGVLLGFLWVLIFARLVLIGGDDDTSSSKGV